MQRTFKNYITSPPYLALSLSLSWVSRLLAKFNLIHPQDMTLEEPIFGLECHTVNISYSDNIGNLEKCHCKH